MRPLGFRHPRLECIAILIYEEEIKVEEMELKNLGENEKKKTHFLNKLLSRGALIGDTDKSKITLYVNLTMNP